MYIGLNTLFLDSMKFASPQFLFALSAIAIPIIIHLFNFRKYKRIVFTNVRYLREIKEETTSRNKLKHLLVLAARILAITFLVLAFAQPYIPGDNQVEQAGSNVVSIYIDNSFSMEARDGEGSLLEEAKQKATEITNAYGLNDRFQVLTNDFEGKHQRLLSRDEFLEELASIKISANTKTIEEVSERQASIFYNQNNTNKIAYLISDFQRGNIKPDLILPDSSIRYKLILLQHKALANLAIDSVWLLNPLHQANGNEQILVRLYNNSDETVEQLPLKIHINGQQKAIGSIDIPARGYALDTFRYTNDAQDIQQGWVEISDYPISFDDRYYFSYPLARSSNILLINGQKNSQYIQTVYALDDFYKLTSASVQQVDYAAFTNQELIILNEVPSISSGMADELKKFLTKGGNLFIIPAFDADLESYNRAFASLGLDPLQNIQVTDTRVGKLNTRQGILKDVFEKVPANMDLPQVRQYFDMSIRSGSVRENILSLQNDAPFLSSYALHGGRVYVLASSLDPEFSNFARHAVFVPFMLRIAQKNALNENLAYHIGKDTQVRKSGLQRTQQQDIRIQKAEYSFIPDLRMEGSEAVLFLSDQLQEAGFYSLVQNNQTLDVLAFNYDRRESQLQYQTVEELEQLGISGFETIRSSQVSLEKTIREANFGVRLWKICIILALLFFTIEMLLIRFWEVFFATKSISAGI